MNSNKIQFRNSIVAYPSYSDQIFESIKDMIIRGDYKPGDRLYEKEISRSLGISRSPIREALQRLSTEGLVRIVPRIGTFVSCLTLEEVLEFYDVRLPLEVTAVRLAIERADQTQINRLSDLLDRTRKRIIQNDQSQYPWNLDFHLQIVRCSKNKKLYDILGMINAQLILVRHQSSCEVGRTEEVFNEHTQIFEALRDKDLEKAEQFMKAHLYNAKENVTRILKNPQLAREGII
jgi:DNA-binding GntR family transcriptional regulator